MRMLSWARGSRSHDGKRNYAIVQFLLQTGLVNPSLTGSSLSLYTCEVVTLYFGEVLTSMPVCC